MEYSFRAPPSPNLRHQPATNQRAAQGTATESPRPQRRILFSRRPPRNAQPRPPAPPATGQLASPPPEDVGQDTPYAVTPQRRPGFFRSWISGVGARVIRVLRSAPPHSPLALSASEQSSTTLSSRSMAVSPRQPGRFRQLISRGRAVAGSTAKAAYLTSQGLKAGLFRDDAARVRAALIQGSKSWARFSDNRNSPYSYSLIRNATQARSNANVLIGRAKEFTRYMGLERPDAEELVNHARNADSFNEFLDKVNRMEIIRPEKKSDSLAFLRKDLTLSDLRVGLDNPESHHAVITDLQYGEAAAGDTARLSNALAFYLIAGISGRARSKKDLAPVIARVLVPEERSE